MAGDTFAEGTVVLKAEGLDTVIEASTKAANAIKGIDQSVTAVETALKKQIATFGLSSNAVAIWELKAKGATKAQLDGITALMNQLDRLKAKQQEVANAGAKSAGGGQPGGLYGQLKGLSQFSSQTAGIVSGLAALGGVKIAADALGQLAKKASDLRSAYERGEISAGEFSDELVRSVPIAGNVYGALMDSSGALQDYAAAALRATEGNEGLAKAFESSATAAARAEKAYEGLKAMKELALGLSKTGRDAAGGNPYADAEMARADAYREAARVFEEGGGRNPATPKGIRKQLEDQGLVARRKADENYFNALSKADAAEQAPLAAEQDPKQGNSGPSKQEQMAEAMWDIVNALNQQNDLWGKNAENVARAKLLQEGYTEADLKAYDDAIAKRKQLQQQRRNFGAAMGDAIDAIAGAGVAAGKAGGVAAGVGGDRKQAVKDFDDLLKQLQENIDFKGMTENQKTVERARRDGVPEGKLDQLEKLLAAQPKEQKGGTEFLSAAGVADYVQQAIGSAPDQRAAAKAAVEAAASAKKQADCVEANAMKVTIVKMPPVVAVLS